jgi:hypothetical protein
MKKQFIVLIFSLIITSGSEVLSQNVQSELSSKFPAVVNFTPAKLSNMFSLNIGQSFEMVFTETINLKGTTLKKHQANSSNQSVIIKFNNLENSIARFSRVVKEGGQVVYQGQIISQFSDACYILKQIDNTYQLIKTSKEVLVPTCSIF